eukprot:922583_1
MQDHLASLRSLIQDKENIIENLMLRYDLGIITQDSNRQNGANLGPDEIEMDELRRKAEALAQRTILENFELREMVNELRDENFHLRNEIYELQDKINRQVLQINKLEKSVQQSAEIATNTANTAGQSHTMDVYEQEEEDEDMNDIYDAEEEEEQFDDAPSNDDARLTGRRESRTMDHPANSDEARAKRQARANHNRKESVKPPDMFGDGNSDSDYEMDGDAQAKHNERQNKTRKESVATPDIYGDAQGESEEDGDDEEDEEDEDVNGAQPQQTGGTKRRGSQIYMNEEAMAKRQARSNHRRGSSVAAPNLFGDNYDPEKAAKDKAKKYAPEAIQKRLQRKAKRVGAAAVKHVKSHRRKESLAEKLLLGPMMDDDIKAADMDPEERKELQAKARKEQRRKSRQLIKSQVGAKEHFSDDDVELQEDKPQRARRKKKKAPPPPVQGNEDIQMTQYTQQMNKKRASIKADPVTLSADDKKLILFKGSTWSLTSDDVGSSDSEYEHVRLKSVHERKATPHNLATPNEDGDEEYSARFANAVATLHDDDDEMNDEELNECANKSSKHRVRVSVTNVDFSQDLLHCDGEEEYSAESEENILGKLREIGAKASPLGVAAREKHKRGVSWGTVTRIELDYAVDSEVAMNTNQNKTPLTPPQLNMKNHSSPQTVKKRRKVRMKLNAVASDNVTRSHQISHHHHHNIKSKTHTTHNAQGKGRHRRDSSTPIVDLGFEDPDVLLHYEKLKVQDLEKELRDKLNELDEVKKDRDSIKTQINASTTTANRATVVAQTAGRELDEAIQSKADLAQKCAMEIMRLTMILNTLQQMPKFREIVQLLMDESAKDNKPINCDNRRRSILIKPSYFK